MIMEERKGTLLKAAFAWEDLKLNSDGMVCVVVQDDKNKDVLMVAYMNREAYEKHAEEKNPVNVNWFAVGGVILGAIVANILNWGIASINGMAVAAICYVIGWFVHKK